MARRPKSQAAPPAGPPPVMPPGRVAPAENWVGTAFRSRSVWLGFALVGLTLLAYWPALSGGFIWDDDAHVTANPCIVGPLGLADIWTSTQARICPLVLSTFWVEYRFWGLDPLPYHLVNILMHAAGALVLWRVLRVLRIPGAWLGAALWALHPVQVESVAWITELKNTQSGFFFLLSVLCFAQYRQTGPEVAAPRRPRLHYGLTVVFAALAMASKSSTVVLPLILGLCAWWIDRGWYWRRNLVQLTPLLLLSIVTSLVTMWTQQHEGGFDPEFRRSFAERLAGVGHVIAFYAGKLFWPHPLIFIYPRWQIDPSKIASWLPTLAIVGLLIVLWWQRDRRGRNVFFAAAFFVIALLPVLGLVEAFFWRYSFVGDHFQYLASMGPLALAAAGVTTGLTTLQNRPPWMLRGIGTSLLLILGLLSWRQCAIYRNDEQLWISTLRLNSEAWIAHNNLAVDLSSQPGRSADAIHHFEETLRLRPRDAKAHYNLAQELRKLPDRQADAIAQYDEALRLNPGLGLAHQNLAALLATVPGRQDEAIAHYEAALRLMPDAAETHYNLALELAQRPERTADAIAHFREALRLRPDFAEAHFNLAIALAQQPGKTAEAIDHYESALRLRPDWLEALTNYAILLSEQPGRLPEAITRYEQALRLQPDSPRVHYNLASAYYRGGRVADAIRELETTIKLDPNNGDARRYLAVLRQKQEN